MVEGTARYSRAPAQLFESEFAVPSGETPQQDSLQDLDERTKALLREASEASCHATRDRLRDDAVKINMPLARAIASRYRAKGVEWDDLVQVAYLALTKAVAGFDPTSPYRFSAYATATVRGEIKRWFRDHDWVVRPPRRYQDLRLVISQRESALAQELGRTPRADDVAAELGVSTQDVQASAVACQGRRSLSLDAPTYDPGSFSLGDTVPDPDDDIDTLEWRLCLGESLARLSPRARLILRMRFENEATQAEIGQALGVSQMHVSRLLSRLLDQLREDLRPAV
jgi:RNA polymerase sigma-B factor